MPKVLHLFDEEDLANSNDTGPYANRKFTSGAVTQWFHNKSWITQQLRTYLGWLVGMITATQLVLLAFSLNNHAINGKHIANFVKKFKYRE